MAFEAPLKVIQRLNGYPKAWCIAGGWSIDFFLGYQTREHEAVEILVYRRDQMELQAHLKDWPLRKVISHGDGTATVIPWERGEWLSLPIHQVRSFGTNNMPGFDFMLNEAIDESWAYRRNLTITRPRKQAERYTETGIPYLAPEVALLYKAHHRREKDQRDFEQVYIKLESEPRSWLITALKTCYPGHPWTTILRTSDH